jgi:hypothetical protein
MFLRCESINKKKKKNCFCFTNVWVPFSRFMLLLKFTWAKEKKKIFICAYSWFLNFFHIIVQFLCSPVMLNIYLWLPFLYSFYRLDCNPYTSIVANRNRHIFVWTRRCPTRLVNATTGRTETGQKPTLGVHRSAVTSRFVAPCIDRYDQFVREGTVRYSWL